MEFPAALQPTEAQRLRQVGLERRIFPILLMIGAAMWTGLALLALTFPLSDVLATAGLGVGYSAVFLVCHRQAHRSPAPLVWVSVESIGVIGLLAYVMTWSGGVGSPALPLTIMTAIVIGMRYPLPWGAAHVAVSVGAIVTGMWVGDRAALQDSPVLAMSFIFAFVLAAVASTMLARAERGAHRESLHDPLTGALNRKALSARLDDARAQPGRRTETLSVIAADLDGLKTVNDRHGHGVGDDTLRAVASRLSASIRDGDLLYRLGGDEFLIVLPAASTDQATDLAERLRATIGTLGPIGHGVTLSAGVAGVTDGPVDLAHLVRCADRALYAAKAGGRDRVCLAEPDPPAVPVAD